MREREKGRWCRYCSVGLVHRMMIKMVIRGRGEREWRERSEAANGQTLSLAFAESQTRAYPIPWRASQPDGQPTRNLATNKPLITQWADAGEPESRDCRSWCGGQCSIPFSMRSSRARQRENAWQTDRQALLDTPTGSKTNQNPILV